MPSNQSVKQPALIKLEPLQTNKISVNQIQSIPASKSKCVNPFRKVEDATRSCSSKENPFSILKSCASSTTHSETRSVYLMKKDSNLPKLLRSFSCTDVSRFSPTKNKDSDDSDASNHSDDQYENKLECMSDVEDAFGSNSFSSNTVLQNAKFTKKIKTTQVSTHLESILLKKPLTTIHENIPSSRQILQLKSKSMHVILPENESIHEQHDIYPNEDASDVSDSEQKVDQLLYKNELEMRYSNVRFEFNTFIRDSLVLFHLLNGL